MGLRVELNGIPDVLSGMILNLKDVDQAFDLFFQQPHVDSSRQAFARRAYSFFKKRFVNYFKRLTVSYESSTLTFDGRVFRYQHHSFCDFYQGPICLRRKLIIESLRPFSKSHLNSLRSQPWESSEKFVEGLKKLKAPLISAQIECPERRGWQKWNLLESSEID